jgi:hypothetical protein
MVNRTAAASPLVFPLQVSPMIIWWTHQDLNLGPLACETEFTHQRATRCAKNGRIPAPFPGSL